MFHDEHQVAERVKAPWSEEEICRLAEKEGELLASGVKPALINSKSVPLFTNRSKESIKGARRKEHYKERVRLVVERIGRETQESRRAVSNPTDSVLDTTSDLPREVDARSAWRSVVLIAVNEGLQEDRREREVEPLKAMIS